MKERYLTERRRFGLGCSSPGGGRGRTARPAQADGAEFCGSRKPFPDFAWPGTGCGSQCRRETHCRLVIEARTFSPRPTRRQGLAWSPGGPGGGVAPPPRKSFGPRILFCPDPTPRGPQMRGGQTLPFAHSAKFPLGPPWVGGCCALSPYHMVDPGWQSGEDEGSNGFHNSPPLNPSVGAHSSANTNKPHTPLSSSFSHKVLSLSHPKETAPYAPTLLYKDGMFPKAFTT